MTYRYPRTIAEMIPARRAELEARGGEVTDCPSGHGPRIPRPLEAQTYEQMFCGIWFDCEYPTCFNSMLIESADLAHQLGRPHYDGRQWHKHDGTAWQPIDDDEAEAFFGDRAAEMEAAQAGALAAARAKPTVTYDGVTYKVRSRKTEIPDLAAMDRMAALIWLNQNTHARGTGIRTKPNPLAGMGDVLKVTVR